MNVKKLTILGSIVACGLVLSACNLYKTSGGTSGQGQSQTEASSPQPAVQGQGITITISDKGFEPASLSVKSGQTITWVNTSKKVQVASDPHPTHTANSELTNGGFVAELAPGASANVTLTKVGTWGFHDHLSPSMKGSVTVQ